MAADEERPRHWFAYAGGSSGDESVEVEPTHGYNHQTQQYDVPCVRLGVLSAAGYEQILLPLTAARELARYVLTLTGDDDGPVTR